MERLNRKMCGKSFRMLAINIKESKEDIRDFADGKGFTFALGMDLTGKTATRKYLARGIPLTFIIDSKGNVVRKALGQREWDNPLVVDLLNQMIHER